MADFPGKVSTQTSSQEPQRSFAISSSVDMGFIKSIPGILLIAEIVVGLLVWTLIASTPHYLIPALGWVLFVSITLWLLSIALLVILLLSLHQRLPSVPWPLVLLVFYSVAALLYLTAFLANAATVPGGYYQGHLGASAFFGIVETLLYTASSYFAYLGWRGEGQNAAGSTVPV
ncbi:plasmolipin isoform X1 [Danio rerio]|uniref:Plasmolipin n=1 Tax=Danio rerio TaxID=7955 RepID=PLLP_DANRE|nr:plasmolipin [Danio rerio]XP_005159164.1 plasmolipin isoform X1 [Danio rerio]CAQ13586.1 novel protein similar to vertebrate transmembrane 4 superfamily member 11 (plasmolipin) (TM4SF11) [Danio rerio]|eukprot:NP_001116171.1 plasmolipin [Danio rerio]